MSKVCLLPGWGARAWLTVATALVIVLSSMAPSASKAEAEAMPVACSVIESPLFPVRCVGEIEFVRATHEFAAGYLQADGPRELLPHIINNVMYCESSYNPDAVNDVGPFYGLMQFLPATWHALDGGDWFDPRSQGTNTALLLADSPPGTQWPHCWYA